LSTHTISSLSRCRNPNSVAVFNNYCHRVLKSDELLPINTLSTFYFTHPAVQHNWWRTSHTLYVSFPKRIDPEQRDGHGECWRKPLSRPWRPDVGKSLPRCRYRQCVTQEPIQGWVCGLIMDFPLTSVLPIPNKDVGRVRNTRLLQKRRVFVFEQRGPRTELHVNARGSRACKMLLQGVVS
jgi:hypothetical protein